MLGVCFCKKNYATKNFFFILLKWIDSESIESVL